MPVSRVSTYALHRETLRDVTRTQSDLANLQNQLSSGNKSENFKGLHGQVETFVQLEAKMQKTDTFINNNTLIISRLQTTDVVMDQIIAIAEDYRNLLIQRRNGATGQDVQFDVAAMSLRASATGQLNTTQEGRYLFSGSKTDTQPIREPFPSNVRAGVPDEGYYQGNSEDLYARVQENFLVQYNVRANDMAFQELFAAIDLGLRGDAIDSEDFLEDATAMASQAIESLIALRAEVQQNQVNITEINERHVQLKLYWKGVTEEIIKTDILSASTEVALNEAILQASFQSFARLNELRLTDFLR